MKLEEITYIDPIFLRNNPRDGMQTWVPQTGPWSVWGRFLLQEHARSDKSCVISSMKVPR